MLFYFMLSPQISTIYTVLCKCQPVISWNQWESYSHLPLLFLGNERMVFIKEKKKSKTVSATFFLFFFNLHKITKLLNLVFLVLTGKPAVWLILWELSMAISWKEKCWLWNRFFSSTYFNVMKFKKKKRTKQQKTFLLSIKHAVVIGQQCPPTLQNTPVSLRCACRNKDKHQHQH